MEDDGEEGLPGKRSREVTFPWRAMSLGVAVLQQKMNYDDNNNQSIAVVKIMALFTHASLLLEYMVSHPPTHLPTHECVGTHTYTHLHTRVHMYRHTHIHTPTHECAHTLTHTTLNTSSPRI